MVTVQSLLKVAQSYIGVSEGTSRFKGLINDYNSVRPVPMGYMVKFTDDWCDAFVTVIADKAGATELIGRECGVQRHIDIFKEKGIWLGRQFPKAGDIITFDWDGNGWADHIGFVESVENNRVTTIEGNSNERVQRNTFLWNDKRIMGYARPKYQIVGEVKKAVEVIVQEVIAGKWGSGQERIGKLIAVGYDAQLVQKEVNQVFLDVVRKPINQAEPAMTYLGSMLSKAHMAKVLTLAKQYDILPSLLIVMLHFEGVWGSSNVSRKDNNWGGMTWSDSYVGNPQIKKTKGSQRPSNEGGHYIRYTSVEDFLEDWVYLLRLGGTYKVSGKKGFKEAVKGLFRVGGAKYDYAALGYPKYLERMEARKIGIEKENVGTLKRLDSEWAKEEKKPTEKVIVSNRATTWQTGERMAPWVKGLAFDVMEKKEVTQEAYLLGSNGIAIGWLMEEDVVGM
ncbi:CHAP domain-containing protein [Aerococcaceae bacterium DSM 111021]|nr:CHAP domain-containing protein [Aerococcaceae bacterium DSM 111021]